MVFLRRRVIGRRGRFDIRRWWAIGLMVARGDRRLLVEAVAALVWAVVILRPLRGERNAIGRQSPLEDQGLPGWSRECRREALGAVARGGEMTLVSLACIRRQMCVRRMWRCCRLILGRGLYIFWGGIATSGAAQR